MGRGGQFHRAGQLFKFRGKDLKLGGECFGIHFRKVCGSVEKRVEHHGDARKDRLFDTLERIHELLLLVHPDHHAILPQDS